MAEPITIGGQTFIKTQDGWVDKKTKVRAPEGLTTLLENMNTENTPQEKKKRVRIDTSRPVVKLGKSEYVWDLNGKTWIDKKTKDPVNPSFSKLIEATYQGIEYGVTPDDQLYKKQISDAASKSMGTAGQAAKQKVKKPTGKGQFAVPNVKINSPIVKMIEKLATIDTYLKQRLENQKMIAAKNIVAAKEQQIESTAAIDAQPVIDEEKIDAEVEAENKKANAAMIAFGIGAAGLIASQFDPVKEAFAGVVDFGKNVYEYLKGFVTITNNALTGLINIGNYIPGIQETTPSTPTIGGSQSSQASTSSQGSSQASQAGSSQTGSSNPNVSSSSSTGSSATPVASDEIVVTAPRSSSASSSSTSSDEIVVTAPRRSSSGSSSSSSSSSGSSDATRQSASPPTSSAPVSSQATSSYLRDAQNGTVWAGTDASGMKTFVRKINNKFETWTSTDGTHYDIDESQAQAQISSRGLRNVNTDDATRQPAAADQTNGYISPVEGHGVNSGYGWRGAVAGAHSGRHFHHGVDIAAPEGTPVRAARGGKVTLVASGWHGYGNVVAIDHDDGKRTIYCHLSRFACRQGDTVQQGQIIGYVGSTGVSTGPHLHFMVQTGSLQVPATSGAGYGTVNPGSLTFTDGTTIPASMEGYSMEGDSSSSESVLSKAAGAGWEMTKGAIEAVSNIIRAGAGEYKTTTGSQLTSFDTEMAGRINAAAREKNAAMADAKTTEDVKKVSDPLNLNAKSGSPVVQNLASSADIDQVQKYLTRMGFPKIEYHIQTPRMNVA